MRRLCLVVRDGAGFRFRGQSTSFAAQNRDPTPKPALRLALTPAPALRLALALSALCPSAEDGDVDGAPVQVGSAAQLGQVGRGEGWHGDGLEQAAVEPRNVVHAIQAAVLHGGEKLREALGQPLGRGLLVVEQPLKHAAGQQAHVFGKEAEHTLREEVAGHGRRGAVGAQPLGHAGKGCLLYTSPSPRD